MSVNDFACFSAFALVFACGTPSEQTPAEPESPTDPIDAMPVVENDQLPNDVVLRESANKLGCDDLKARVLSTRKDLNKCEADADCVELGGTCQLGSHYANTQANMGALHIFENAFNARCHQTLECGGEPLGPAVCQTGQCVSAGLDFQKADPEGCAYQPYLYANANGMSFIPTWASASSSNMTNILVIAEAGLWTLEVKWPEGCGDCVLTIMVEGDATETNLAKADKEKKTTYTAALEPERYHFSAVSATEGQTVEIRHTLLDANGALIVETHQGMRWKKVCSPKVDEPPLITPTPTAP
jgi:hypothetical protein